MEIRHTIRPLVAAGALLVVGASCRPTVPPWAPTREDLSSSTGPDPGSCEALHVCPIPK
jgi:hypothetical protein